MWRSLVGIIALLTIVIGCAGALAPREPRSVERECGDDSDCVFRPESPCDCDPCGETWRRAVSQQAAEDLLAEMVASPCQPQECEPCDRETVRRGSEAVCIRGQCTVRETR
jgi:hypothetical protein